MRKAVVLVAFLFAYMMLVIGINVAHFRFVPVNVVLYATLADAVLAAVIIAAVIAVVGKSSKSAWFIGDTIRNLTGTERALLLLCAILIGCIFAISVPTIIDRSLSIYILEKLNQRGGAISLDAMNEIFVKEFIPEHRLMDVRMTEQISSGTVTIEDGCVRLTPRGKSIVALTRYYRTEVLPKKRVLMGEVTSDLTDPFKDGSAVVDYRCHAEQRPGKR
jgi:hypothetical protein